MISFLLQNKKEDIWSRRLLVTKDSQEERIYYYYYCPVFQLDIY